MSQMKIKNENSMKARRLRQKVTRNLTNKQRQEWGVNGRQLDSKGNPKGFERRH